MNEIMVDEISGPTPPPQMDRIENVSGCKHHEPIVTYLMSPMGFYLMTMKHTVLAGMKYEEAMEEFKRTIDWMFKAYLEVEKEREDPPSCAPPADAAPLQPH